MDRPYNEIELEQSSPEWYEWRNGGIGASDAPAIMGENRFKSANQLLNEKRNKVRFEPNVKMLMGTIMEPEARQEYIEQYGIHVEPLCVQAKSHSWLRASLDGISLERNKLVEIKCGESAYKKAQSGYVPKYYYGQLQHQIMITGLTRIDYWCYLTGSPGLCIPVERDEEYIIRLFEEERRFFEKL